MLSLVIARQLADGAEVFTHPSSLKDVGIVVGILADPDGIKVGFSVVGFVIVGENVGKSLIVLG